MQRIKILVAAVSAAFAVGGLTACDPPPPRLQLTVTTTAAGTDDDPGDGICHSTPAGGCSLQAAIGEGNTASDGVDIAIPPGDYAAFTAGIIGDVRIAASAPASTRLGDSYGVHLTVLSQGRLEIADLNTGGDGLPWPFRVVVDGGVFISHRSALAAQHGVVPLSPLFVEAPGTAVLVDSVVLSPEYQSVLNRGTFVAVRSSLLSSFTFTGLDTVFPATSTLQASAIARLNAFPGEGGGCSGEPPVSYGYIHIEEPCGSDPMPTDGEGSTEHPYSETSRLHVSMSSPLIDAIPIDDPACIVGSTDVYGQPRGVDGNGDGVPGCDIGAIERQP